MASDLTLSQDKAKLRGATLTADGAYFSIYSENATAQNIYLLDELGNDIKIVPLNPPSEADRAAGHHLWTKMEPGIAAGQRYQVSADGPDAPEQGHRFNKNKRLIDPHAKKILVSHLQDENEAKRFDRSHYGYIWNDPLADLSFNSTSNAGKAAYSVVTAPQPKVDPKSRLNTPWDETIVYEMSVDKLTRALNPIKLPAGAKPGSFTAAASDTVIDLLKMAGITAVELMPVHMHQPQGFLRDRGLKDEWHYNTINFFTPEPELGSPEEFRAMVDKLHAAGIEIILDVVYNHTGEGNEMGPTISFKGLDNRTYYLPAYQRYQDPQGKWKTVLDENGDVVTNPRFYEKDATGCGNTLNFDHPEVRKMVIDSLKYWVEEMGVDGFRFDLGSVLGEDKNGRFNGNFLREIEDTFPIEYDEAGKVVHEVKLIMEPWHPGTDGRDFEFSSRWKVWGLDFRNAARNMLRAGASAREMVHLMTQTSDQSINYIVAHDGQTRLDMSMYEKKNNWVNGEGNRDGDEVDAWNCGAEGPTADPNIIALRHAQVENSLAINILARKGVPMLHESDLFWGTRRGNNNGWCTEQPSDWNKINEDHVRFIGTLAKLKTKFSQQTTMVSVYDTQARKLSMDEAMSQPDWVKACCMEFQTVAGKGKQERFLLALNTHWDSVSAKLPELGGGLLWKVLSDTHTDEPPSRPASYSDIFGRSLQIMKAVDTDPKASAPVEKIPTLPAPAL